MTAIEQFADIATVQRWLLEQLEILAAAPPDEKRAAAWSARLRELTARQRQLQREVDRFLEESTT